MCHFQDHVELQLSERRELNGSSGKCSRECRTRAAVPWSLNGSNLVVEVALIPYPSGKCNFNVFPGHTKLCAAPLQLCVCVFFYVFCVFNRVSPTGQAKCEGYESPMTVLVGVEPATPLHVHYSTYSCRGTDSTYCILVLCVTLCLKCVVNHGSRCAKRYSRESKLHF